MSTKSRQHLYGTTIRMSAERAKHARKEADRLAVEAPDLTAFKWVDDYSR